MLDPGSVALVDQLHQALMVRVVVIPARPVRPISPRTRACGPLRIAGLAGRSSRGVDSGRVQAAPAVLESSSRAPAQQPHGDEHHLPPPTPP